MASITFIGKENDICDRTTIVHRNWQLIYCTKGTLDLYVRGRKELRYGVNQAVLIPPQTPFYHKGSAKNSVIRVSIADLAMHADIPMRMNDNVKCDLGTMLNMCLRYFVTRTEDATPPQQMLQAFTTLLIALFDLLRRMEKLSDHVESISTQITENFHDPDFDLDALYEQFPLSKDYLRRQFIKERGISPVQMLNRLRIAHAQELLAGRSFNRLKVNEIAIRCGFRDQLYFSRVFKKMTGYAPKDYLDGGEEV